MKGHVMINGFWGRKIGMTQVFSDDHKVVPVTVIDLARWLVTQVKTAQKDGYSSVQLGCVKKRYESSEFSSEWMQEPHKYFSVRKEVRLAEDLSQDLQVGSAFSIDEFIAKGDNVDVVGISIGRGFQGGVKRHGFTGGVASHGSKLGRKGGSLGFMRSQGRVMKNKRMPGHMGVDRCMIKNLEIVQIEPQARIVLVKGSVPGKSGSLVYLTKRGDN
jgi:large subunit ribosomal protein L3